MSRDKQIEEMVVLMCGERKKHKSCKACKSGNPNANAYCRIEHYAEILYNAGYRKASDVAREIFEEIEQEIAAALKSNYKVLPQVIDSYEIYHTVKGKISALCGIDGFIAELKKKYESEGKE